MKKGNDSWVDDIQSEDKNFIGRKATDISLFRYGTTIPNRYVDLFLDNLSKKVTQGKGVKVKIKVNNEIFEGSVRWPSLAGRNNILLQIRYSNKRLSELLRKTLNISYEYIVDYEKRTGKKPKEIPEEYIEYVDFLKGDKLDTFVMKLHPKGEELEEEELLDEDVINENTYNKREFKPLDNINDELKYIHSYIESKGFQYSEELIKNIYLCLKSKPFLILSGISGTGKSKIVELFAEALGATIENKRFTLVPVKPDWSDSTDLLGYRSYKKIN